MLGGAGAPLPRLAIHDVLPQRVLTRNLDAHELLQTSSAALL
jgi:hypothetical protein